MSHLYIGLISGTSIDGIDAALVHFDSSSLEVLQTREYDYPAALRQALLLAILDTGIRTVEDVADLDKEVGECFRDAANSLLEDAGVDRENISAIGSHGQTIRHEPDAEKPFSLQIGDPDIIAAGTGIRTIADFRSADIALGGQGAPLTPAFHEWLFGQSGSDRVVLNIGGIANVSVLRGDGADTTGFDTGPGNTLLDAWIRQHGEAAFDRGGAWASEGLAHEALRQRLLADPYFAEAPPKSTGFEYFNLDWLDAKGVAECEPVDVQATLSTLTAISIAAAIRDHAGDATDVFVCGGGAHNCDLMQRLRVALPETSISTTESVGLDPDWVEAVAFAWLAMRTTNGLPGNLPAVTGASAATVLGSVHQPG